MKDRLISADDYGFFLLSVCKLEEFVKGKKIKAKNLLNYFAKNADVLNEAIQAGTLLPINQIPAYSYTIFCELAGKYEMLPDWDTVLEEGPFNICVLDNSLWAISLSQLNEWALTDFPITEENTGYWVESGPNGDKEYLFTGQQFSIPSGDYLVTVQGIRKKALSGNENADYGYVFQLSPSNIATNAISPDLKPKFDITEL